MASFSQAPASEESGKNAYRADCVAPVKDTRVQTTVSIVTYLHILIHFVEVIPLMLHTFTNSAILSW